MSVANIEGPYKSWIAIGAQMKEIHGKSHLRQKEHDEFRETSQSQIKENDNILHDFRDATRKKYATVASHTRNDERMFKIVWKNERKMVLAHRRLSADNVKYRMDQRFLLARNGHNFVIYERKKREEKLKKTLWELDRMHKLEKAYFEDANKDSPLRRIEKNMDKVIFKHRIAISVTRCYREIVEMLKIEHRKHPAKIDAVDVIIRDQKVELKELKAMSIKNLAAQDKGRRLLAKVEAKAYDGKYLRDSELKGLTANHLERRKSEQETRPVRTTMVVDPAEQKSQEMTTEHERKKQLLSYEDAFQRIMEVANVTQFQGTLDRVADHQDTQARLTLQLSEQNNQRNKFLDKFESLTIQFHDMKYSGEQKLSRGQQRAEHLQQQLVDAKARRKQVTEHSQSCGNTLLLIKAGVATIVDKLINVKLKPPNHSSTRGDVFDQLALCRKKLDEVIEDLTSGFGVRLLDKNHPEFREFMESRVPTQNLRLTIDKTDSAIGFNFVSSEGTQEILTRVDIKRLGQKLIDAKNKPQKEEKPLKKSKK